MNRLRLFMAAGLAPVNAPHAPLWLPDRLPSEGPPPRPWGLYAAAAAAIAAGLWLATQ